MLPQWFKHLPPPEQEKRKRFVLANKEILDIAAEIVYNMSIDEDLSKDQYSDSSWSARQADRIGYRRALRDIHKLLTVKEV